MHRRALLRCRVPRPDVHITRRRAPSSCVSRAETRRCKGKQMIDIKNKKTEEGDRESCAARRPLRAFTVKSALWCRIVSRTLIGNCAQASMRIHSLSSASTGFLVESTIGYITRRHRDSRKKEATVRSLQSTRVGGESDSLRAVNVRELRSPVFRSKTHLHNTTATSRGLEAEGTRARVIEKTQQPAPVLT